MKAWVLHDIGDIRYEDVTMPHLKDNEVRIKVAACGICGSDIPRVYKTGAHRMPLIPGHEFAGVVHETGGAADPSLKGKKVGVFPLIPCKKCGPCLNSHPEMCRDYDYVGSRRDGAFAEYVDVPESNLVILPEGILLREAAMLEPMAVAVHAMFLGIMDGEGEISKNSRVAVCGLGTIGLLLAMFLKERGFENLYVMGNKNSQRERALKLGITEDRYINSRSEDPFEGSEIKEDGFDLYFECVGRNECLSLGVGYLSPGGRMVTVGNPYSDMTLDRDTYWKILRNQLTIRGTWNSTFLQRDGREEISDDWDYVIRRLKDKRIRPGELISHRMPLEELERGLHIMRDKTEDYCKVMTVSDDGVIS